MKDILIIAHFTQIPGEPGNGRFHYIAEKINKKYANVELVTTSFSHKNKKQRLLTKEQIESLSYKLTMVFEPDYMKNVSIKRFYCHHVMGLNLKKYLKSRKKPDVIYCAVPSLSVAYIAAQYAKNNDIKFIIDIQDLWPEAFKMVFRLPLINDIIFYPMKKQADYIYQSADEIVAVSQTYLDKAIKLNKRCISGKSVYLGTDIKNFDTIAKLNKHLNKSKNEIWLAYIGTLGHSYDLRLVIDALAIIKNKGITDIKFIIIGDGPLKEKFESYSIKKNVSAEFIGRLSYEKMAGILTVCDIAVNPIKKGSAGSIINKVGDYAAASLPVLNTQECKEYRDLLEHYEAGINCINTNPNDVANKLMTLCKDVELRERMGTNNRKLAEEKFDRVYTYRSIIDLIE